MLRFGGGCLTAAVSPPPPAVLPYIPILLLLAHSRSRAIYGHPPETHAQAVAMTMLDPSASPESGSPVSWLAPREGDRRQPPGEGGDEGAGRETCAP